jgi:hypothetical protein
VGKAVEKAAQDIGKTVEKAAQDTGKTVEKAAQDTGKTLEKAAQDTGKTLEKAAQDTGKTIEKAAHDTGHALEKAGQDVGHLLKQLTNFKLDCDLPPSKPAELAPGYQATCGGNFSSYRNDLDVCKQAGGASLIAAGAAGAAGLGVAATAGGTYVLAKAAFELCQKACRSQKSLSQCIARTDTAVAGASSELDKSKQRNDEAQEQLALFQCVDDAFAGEKMLVMDSVLSECEANKTCNVNSKLFDAEFEKKVKAKLDAIEMRRQRVKESLKTKGAIPKDYGPVVASPPLKSLTLVYPTKPTVAVCRARTPALVLRIALASTRKSMEVRWYRDGAKVFVSPLTVDEKGSIDVAFNLAGRGVGKWEARVVANEVLLGSYRFVYRPEDF